MRANTSTTLLLNGAVEHPVELVQRAGPLESLLSLATPMAGADHATVSSSDGQYRASIPLEWLRRGRLQGGRLVIPGAPTKCWSVKDVVSVEITRGPRPDSVRPESFDKCVPES